MLYIHTFNALPEDKMKFMETLRHDSRFSIAVVPDDIRYFPYDPEEYTNIIIVDLSCPETLNLLHDVGQYLYLYYKWIILNTNSRSSDVQNSALLDVHSSRELFLYSLEPLPILISSEIFVFLEQTATEYKIAKCM